MLLNSVISSINTETRKYKHSLRKYRLQNPVSVELNDSYTCMHTLGIASDHACLIFFNALLRFMAHVNTYQASTALDSCMSKTMFPWQGWIPSIRHRLFEPSHLMCSRRGKVYLWNALEQDVELHFEPGQDPSTLRASMSSFWNYELIAPLYAIKGDNACKQITGVPSAVYSQMPTVVITYDSGMEKTEPSWLCQSRRIVLVPKLSQRFCLFFHCWSILYMHTCFPWEHLTMSGDIFGSDLWEWGKDAVIGTSGERQKCLFMSILQCTRHICFPHPPSSIEEFPDSKCWSRRSRENFK